MSKEKEAKEEPQEEKGMIEQVEETIQENKEQTEGDETLLTQVKDAAKKLAIADSAASGDDKSDDPFDFSDPADVEIPAGDEQEEGSKKEPESEPEKVAEEEDSGDKGDEETDKEDFSELSEKEQKIVQDAIDGIDATSSETIEARPVTEFARKMGSKIGLTDEQMDRLGGVALETYLTVNDEVAVSGGGKEITGEVEDTSFKATLGLDPDEHDTDVVKAFEGKLGEMHKSFTSQLATQQAVIDDMKEQTLAAQVNQRVNWVQGKIDALDDIEWKEVKGKPDETNKILARFGVIGEGFVREGQELDYDKIFKASIDSLYGDNKATIERRKIAKKVSKNQDQLIARTKQQDVTKKLSPTKNAVKAVTAKMREKGIDVEEDNDDYDHVADFFD